LKSACGYQGAFTGKEGSLGATWDSSYISYTLRWEVAGILHAIQWSIPIPEKAKITPNEQLLVTLGPTFIHDIVGEPHWT